ncbi:L-2-hydroxyisocaproate dehydrogenase [Weissella viridescens]|uniref:L-2-hydroxyisocaproate dehydrogenase n=1 Tax=Weissella viridescens TaxID=1629 RepID=A0A380P315_WEIVI|nr:L-2-hydroxyisocaproate dehydrogenase [Weissella viridescens]
MNDSHEELPVSTFREGHEVALSYPAVIGRDGVLGHGHLHLTDEEETKLTGSYDFVTERYHLLLEKIEIMNFNKTNPVVKYTVGFV